MPRRAPIAGNSEGRRHPPASHTLPRWHTKQSLSRYVVDTANDYLLRP
jgi:hypothetical protein